MGRNEHIHANCRLEIKTAYPFCRKEKKQQKHWKALALKQQTKTTNCFLESFTLQVNHYSQIMRQFFY